MLVPVFALVFACTYVRAHLAASSFALESVARNQSGHKSGLQVFVTQKRCAGDQRNKSGSQFGYKTPVAAQATDLRGDFAIQPKPPR